MPPEQHCSSLCDPMKLSTTHPGHRRCLFRACLGSLRTVGGPPGVWWVCDSPGART